MGLERDTTCVKIEELQRKERRAEIEKKISLFREFIEPRFED